MKPSPMVVLLLLLLVSQARGIRLEKGLFEFGGGRTGTRTRTSREHKNSEAVIAGKNGGGDCLETMKKRVAPQKGFKKPYSHWLPGMQEDYRGPRSHKPRHH